MESSSSFTDSAPQTGTTIVAAAYPGGVVLGADTRVTTGTLPLALLCLLVAERRAARDVH
jgi:20S proteasome alpha/beta subunit